MHTLQFCNYSGSCNVNPYMGVSLYDYLFRFSYTFTSGKVYGLIGSPGTGNCALPHIICGNSPDSDSVSGKILIDGAAADSEMLKRSCCYAGQPPLSLNKHISLYRNRTPASKLISEGLYHTESLHSLSELAEIFHLTDLDKSDGRINRPFDSLGNEKWRASLTIGYAWGKRIFAFPLITYPYLFLAKIQAQLGIFDFLKNEESIIIVPAVNEKNIADICDEFIYMDDLREAAVEAEKAASSGN